MFVLAVPDVIRAVSVHCNFILMFDGFEPMLMG